MYNLTFIFSLVGVLLAVAFFTLMERKVMGLMHYRKGPNKVMIMGILQPITDATKLLTKEYMKIQPMKTFMFWSAPIMGLMIMLSCWMMYESENIIMSTKMKLFLIMALMSLSAFVFLMTSWGSNTKYAILGGYRAVSQVISYEVCLMLFIFVILYSTKTYNMLTMKSIQENMWMLFLSLPFFITWMMMCMAESNRTPFDLAEGESEIVSGFNIEYGGGLFALIFIMEYGMIMFLSFMTTMLFMGNSMTTMKTMMICSIFIWTRCCFPRVRYDKLMNLCWKISLPYSLSVLIIIYTLMFM